MMFFARVAAAMLVLAVLVPPHLLVRLSRRRSPFPGPFLWATGWLAGLRIRTIGQRRLANVLYVANHISWLDILALGGTGRAAFVAKADVETTPLVGWLADQNHTIYVDRSARRAAGDQAGALALALASGRGITLFPEGTTGDGTALLPFRASLFQALVPPPPGIMVQPVWLDYGPLARDIAWASHESGIGNFLRVMRRARRIPLTIHYLPPFAPAAAGDRKAIAGRCHAAIAAHYPARTGL